MMRQQIAMIPEAYAKAYDESGLEIVSQPTD